MHITSSWMEERFSRFNKQFFNDRLPMPRLCVSYARTRLGTMTYKCHKNDGPPVFYAYTIRLSNYYDMSEQELEDVLLHEMIHYHIAIRQIRDTSAHGIMFHKMMERINKKGHNICVSKNMSERAAAMSARQPARRYIKNLYIVLAMTSSRGKYLLSVVNPRYVKNLDAILRRTKEIVEHKWFVSGDAYFQNFSKVRSPRGRVVEKNVYVEKTQAMTPLDINKSL